jgi:hypothetical protein
MWEAINFCIQSGIATAVVLGALTCFMEWCSNG